MRKDSTTLIRKYLDDIKRLEAELALFRRKSMQLGEELKEARDDLQKDEEIFEEKMKEMKELQERNDLLEELLKDKLKVPEPVFAIDLERPSSPVAEEDKREDLEDTRASQQHLSEQLQSLEQNVQLKEELITELTRSEQEWGLARKQYQADEMHLSSLTCYLF